MSKYFFDGLKFAIDNAKNQQNIRLFHGGALNSILMGGGVYYAYFVKNNPYEVPLAVLFPSGYAGFNVVKSLHEYNIEEEKKNKKK